MSHWTAGARVTIGYSSFAFWDLSAAVLLLKQDFQEGEVDISAFATATVWFGKSGAEIFATGFLAHIVYVKLVSDSSFWHRFRIRKLQFYLELPLNSNLSLSVIYCISSWSF